MTKRKRFYLHDVAACMGVEVSRLRILCRYWEVAAHGVHEFEDMRGQRSWLSWAGVKKTGCARTVRRVGTSTKMDDGYKVAKESS